MLMGSDYGGIDDQVFEVRGIGHRLKDAAFGTPSTKAPEYAVPVSERLRKITSGRARGHDPKHSFHEHPIVAAGRTVLVRPAYDQWRHPLPRRVVQNQTIHHA